MGGSKKKGISQMEKSQKEKEDKQVSKKKGKPGPEKKAVSTVGLHQIDEKALLADFAKMKALTPFAVARHLSVRIGIAKQLLQGLANRGSLAQVGGCSRVKIYALATDVTKTSPVLAAAPA